MHSKISLYTILAVLCSKQNSQRIPRPWLVPTFFFSFFFGKPKALLYSFGIHAWQWHIIYDRNLLRHKKYWWVSEKHLILWTSDGPLLGQLPYQHMYLLSCFDKNAILIYFVMSGAVCIVHITNFVFYFILFYCNSV